MTINNQPRSINMAARRRSNTTTNQNIDTNHKIFQDIRELQNMDVTDLSASQVELAKKMLRELTKQIKVKRYHELGLDVMTDHHHCALFDTTIDLEDDDKQPTDRTKLGTFAELFFSARDIDTTLGYSAEQVDRGRFEANPDNPVYDINRCIDMAEANINYFRRVLDKVKDARDRGATHFLAIEKMKDFEKYDEQNDLFID